MKVSETFPTKYIKPLDLQGKDVLLTMREVKLEEMGHGAQKARKPVLYFERTSKGLVLNRTNATTIAGLYGDDSMAWVGKRIIIYPTKVDAFGENKDTIRVKNTPPPPPPQGPASPPPAPSIVEDVEDYTDPDDFEGADPDEFEETAAPESASGSAQANPFDDPTVGASANADNPGRIKPVTLSQSQATRIAVLCVDVYGNDWQSQERPLAEWASKGVVHSIKKLLPDEGDILIKALENRLKSLKAGIAAPATGNDAKNAVEA